MPIRFRRGFCLSFLLFLSVAACHVRQVSPDQLLPAAVQANEALIVGRVVSSRGGRPLESALVQLFTPSGQLVVSARADKGGAFVLDPTAPAIYRLKVQMIAHRSLISTRELHPGSIDALKLRLTYDDAGMTFDCISPERPDSTRGFRSQFCQP